MFCLGLGCLTKYRGKNLQNGWGLGWMENLTKMEDLGGRPIFGSTRVLYFFFCVCVSYFLFKHVVSSIGIKSIMNFRTQSKCVRKSLRQFSITDSKKILDRYQLIRLKLTEATRFLESRFDDQKS